MIKGKINIKKIIGIVILSILVIGGLIAFKISQDNKLVTVRLEVGETLEFLCENKRDGEILIRKPKDIETRYDSISYYKLGGIVYLSKGIYRDQNWFVHDKIYQVNYSLTQGEYLEFTMPAKFEKDIKITKNPIFNTITLNKGESVEVINGGSDCINIEMQLEMDIDMDEDKLKLFDYVAYDNDGDVRNIAGDSNESYVYAKEGEKLILTNKVNETLNLYVPVEFVDYVVKVENSGVIEFEVKNNEILEIENTTEINNMAKVVFDGYDPYKRNEEESFRDMIITDNNGEEKIEKVYTQQLEISPNTKNKIMTSTDEKSIKVYIPADLKEYCKKYISS